MIKDPEVHDPNFWRYQKLIEAYVEKLIDEPSMTGNKQSFINSLAHVAKKIYEMGLEDGTPKIDEPLEPTVVECQNNVCVKTKGIFS